MIVPADELGPAASGMIAVGDSFVDVIGATPIVRSLAIRSHSRLVRSEPNCTSTGYRRNTSPVLKNGRKPVNIQPEPECALTIGLRPGHGGRLPVGTKNPQCSNSRSRVGGVEPHCDVERRGVYRHPWVGVPVSEVGSPRNR